MVTEMSGQVVPFNTVPEYVQPDHGRGYLAVLADGARYVAQFWSSSGDRSDDVTRVFASYREAGRPVTEVLTLW